MNEITNTPLFTNDAIVFGLIGLTLVFIFYTSKIKKGFWKSFYSIVPALLLCYLIPAIYTNLNLIDAEKSQLYYISSRYLLPASLVLMTLSINLKAIVNLGPKALIMFFTRCIEYKSKSNSNETKNYSIICKKRSICNFIHLVVF